MSVQLHQAGRADRSLALNRTPRSFVIALVVLSAVLLLISTRANAALFAERSWSSVAFKCETPNAKANVPPIPATANPPISQIMRVPVS